MGSELVSLQVEPGIQTSPLPHFPVISLGNPFDRITDELAQ